MPTFQYKAMDKKGQVTGGVYEAGDMEGLILGLEKQGLFLIEGHSSKAEKPQSPAQPAPLSPQAAASAPAGVRLAQPGDSVPTKKILMFTTELSIMIRTALPIADALDSLATQQPEPIFRSVIVDIGKSVKEGQSLSMAFSRFPKVFDEIYLSLLRAGESSGQLSEMLDRIVDYLNFYIELQTKIRSALLYPTIVIVTSITVVAFLVLFILPTFMDVFSQLGVKLPLPTRILLGFSAHMRRRWPFYVAGSFIAWRFFLHWLANPHNVKTFDRFKLNVPIAGAVVRSILLVRILRTLSSLLTAGVPVLRSLELVRAGAGNTVYRDLLDKVYKNTSEGLGLSSGLRDTPYFPQAVVDMICNAEKTGTVPEVLDHVSTYYEKETDATLKNFFAALEPLFVVFLGLMVGGIAISILLPIFQLGTAIQ